MIKFIEDSEMTKMEKKREINLIKREFKRSKKNLQNEPLLPKKYEKILAVLKFEKVTKRLYLIVELVYYALLSLTVVLLRGYVFTQAALLFCLNLGVFLFLILNQPFKNPILVIIKSVDRAFNLIINALILILSLDQNFDFVGTTLKVRFLERGMMNFFFLLKFYLMIGTEIYRTVKFAKSRTRGFLRFDRKINKIEVKSPSRSSKQVTFLFIRLQRVKIRSIIFLTAQEKIFRGETAKIWKKIKIERKSQI